MRGCPLHELPNAHCVACNELAVERLQEVIQDHDTEKLLQRRATRAVDICEKAADLVDGERDRTHGSKRQNFNKIAMLWNAYLMIRDKIPASLDETDVGHMMVLLKVARTQHGAFNLDDYIDMAGYAGCAGEIAAEDAANG